MMMDASIVLVCIFYIIETMLVYSIKKITKFGSIKHLEVRTKIELQDALFASRQENRDCVIEVESSIDFNATFHRLSGSIVASIILSNVTVNRLRIETLCYSLQ